jgi:hypothetical protein
MALAHRRPQDLRTCRRGGDGVGLHLGDALVHTDLCPRHAELRVYEGDIVVAAVGVPKLFAGHSCRRVRVEHGRALEGGHLDEVTSSLLLARSCAWMAASTWAELELAVSIGRLSTSSA